MMQQMTMLKTDGLSAWIERAWLPTHPESQWVTLRTQANLLNEDVLASMDRQHALEAGFCFSGAVNEYCPDVPRVQYFTMQSGAYRYRFANPASGATVEMLVLAAYQDDHGFDMVVLVCVPREHLALWHAFHAEVNRLTGLVHAGRHVHVIGGRIYDYHPTVDFGDIILPEALKTEILADVERFYTRGVNVYRQLKLKPFRKLLLAGVPGTGKSLMCNALAKWALGQGYVVIYVSSADCNGATFAKIDQAMRVAEHAQYPTLIVLEELDAYLHQKEKAMVLNVLDGAEGRMNGHGTLLVATTNYPEAIDSRVLKRPGRLDRVFVIPALTNEDEAERMLKLYMGEQWRADHRTIVPRLVGYTGAFVREVAVYALTQVADLELADLPVDLLTRSFEALQAQIDARDDLIEQNNGAPVPNGFVHEDEVYEDAPVCM